MIDVRMGGIRIEQRIIQIKSPAQYNGWTMTQTWEHLLFLHWAISPASIKALIPAGLELDTYDGKAWISIIPFLLSGVRLRRMPSVPFTTTFPEINVRTYVKAKGKTGVYFLSLDTSNPLVIKIAKFWYRLPYYRAQMAFHRQADRIDFTSRRLSGLSQTPSFKGSYQPLSDKFFAKEGTLVHWLTERYTLFCRCDRTKQLMFADVVHEPWQLQETAFHIRENVMTENLSISLTDTPHLALYARGVQSLIWPIRSLADLSSDQGG
ncbi:MULTISPECIES: YqjF family protein [unclassified Brevibacillus]|uniref:YqjF family protein n=1 Tax=unclassified Brevibacillus TaxID=2684853 RepID=UPI003564DFC1